MTKLVVVFMSGLIGAAVLGACGDDIKPMPSVEGRRLDVALSDLARAGVDKQDVEVVGGGALGVVDESKWLVCSQEPDRGQKAQDVRLIVDRECRDLGEGEGSPTTAATSPAAPPTEPVPTTSSGPAAAPAPAPPTRSATLPNVVGMDLQMAQDTLQGSGFYNLSSRDATGRRRSQVIDRNWKVCSQDPAAGATVPIDTAVELAVVRLDVESCP